MVTSLDARKDQIYLIDFGLAHQFSEKDGSHVKKEQKGKFSGNFIFASINQCRTYTCSRRDDIESMFYMLIFMLNKYYLPWCDYQEKF